MSTIKTIATGIISETKKDGLIFMFLALSFDKEL